MQNNLLQSILSYFTLYGYWLLFFGLLLENLFLLGLIVPGETILLLASFLASEGRFSLPIVIIVAGFGAFLGNNFGYFIGRVGGRPFLKKFGRYFFISEKRIKDTEDYFKTYGPRAIFIGRFAAGIRVFVPLIAGISRMSYFKFLFYTTLSVFSWTTLIAFLGYFVGGSLSYLVKITNWIGYVALFVVIVIFVIYYFVRGRENEGR